MKGFFNPLQNIFKKKQPTLEQSTLELENVSKLEDITPDVFKAFCAIWNSSDENKYDKTLCIFQTFDEADAKQQENFINNKKNFKLEKDLENIKVLFTLLSKGKQVISPEEIWALDEKPCKKIKTNINGDDNYNEERRFGILVKVILKNTPFRAKCLKDIIYSCDPYELLLKRFQSKDEDHNARKLDRASHHIQNIIKSIRSCNIEIKTSEEADKVCAIYRKMLDGIFDLYDKKTANNPFKYQDFRGVLIFKDLFESLIKNYLDSDLNKSHDIEGFIFACVQEKGEENGYEKPVIKDDFVRLFKQPQPQQEEEKEEYDGDIARFRAEIDGAEYPTYQVKSSGENQNNNGDFI